jgi:hypothetical protein
VGEGAIISREEFQNRYQADLMIPAFEALKRIVQYRGSNEPLLELGPNLLYHVAIRREVKRKFLNARLLPNADEWNRLRRESPIEERALREFVINWIGFFDPLFHLTFRNNSSAPILVSKINYTATRISVARAELVGAYETPRYFLKLRDGTNDDEFHPPILVPAHSIKEVDLLITLTQVSPGSTYDIKLQFSSQDGKYQATLPTFSAEFFKGK